ncbi:site-specific integrase [Magnetospirillum sp. 15-1]|uniref:tyrosine-type recombinase/integrase n=1 Tax=Magnetospirillum sp. 15-1 TaxID=1979370 RepID=UPI000BBC7018|nr:site-specific integrase [Magnetospirillum sp. 15-1]
MKQAKVLSDREFRRVLTTITEMKYAARNRAAVMLSYFGGLRVGEIAALTVGDVVDTRGEIKERILLRASITKSAEARAMFVGTKLRPELETYIAGLNGDRLNGLSPLLVTQRGGAFTANSLCQLFAHVYREAGVDGASSHSGRRWFITRLAHSGVSAKVIMTLAGHRNLSTTQRYIEVNDEMLRAAVRKL